MIKRYDGNAGDSKILASGPFGVVRMRLIVIFLAVAVLKLTADSLTIGDRLLNAKRVTKEICLANRDADGGFTVVDEAIPRYRIEFFKNGDAVNWWHETVRPADVSFFLHRHSHVNIANPTALTLSSIEGPEAYPLACKPIPERIFNWRMTTIWESFEARSVRFRAIKADSARLQQANEGGLVKRPLLNGRSLVATE